MTMWVLDDGPFGELAFQFDAAWAWPASCLHVVGEVAKLADLDRSQRRRRLLDMSSGGTPSIEVHQIQVGSPASDMLYTHLRRDSVDATENLGEHASIAFCARVAPEAVFVPADKKAAFLALAELGPGRVVTPFDLWAHLHRSGFITRAQFTVLCERTVKGGALPGVPLRFVPRPQATR